MDETKEALLREIRDLLVPISDHYRQGYEEREAARLEATKGRVKDLLSTPTRLRAWGLTDGTRTQREISKQAGLDEGSTSRLFKALRDLDAVIDAPNPTKQVEID